MAPRAGGALQSVRKRRRRRKGLRVKEEKILKGTGLK
jgi:hypothetical protein